MGVRVDEREPSSSLVVNTLAAGEVAMRGDGERVLDSDGRGQVSDSVLLANFDFAGPVHGRLRVWLVHKRLHRICSLFPPTTHPGPTTTFSTLIPMGVDSAFCSLRSERLRASVTRRVSDRSATSRAQNSLLSQSMNRSTLDSITSADTSGPER